MLGGRVRLAAAQAAFSAVLVFSSPAWAGEGEAAAAGSGLSLFFYAVNFLLFVWLLRRFLMPPAKLFFRQRADQVRESLERANADFAEAEQKAERARAAMAALEAEKARLAEAVQAQTAVLTQRLTRLARENAARIARDAEMTARAMEENARREVRRRLARGAAATAREMLVRQLGNEDRARLIGRFVRQAARERRAG